LRAERTKGLEISKHKKERTLADIEEKYPAPDESEAEDRRKKANKRNTVSRFSTRSCAEKLTMKF
jgi:hypothetical protein